MACGGEVKDVVMRVPDGLSLSHPCRVVLDVSHLLRVHLVDVVQQNADPVQRVPSVAAVVVEWAVVPRRRRVTAVHRAHHREERHSRDCSVIVVAVAGTGRGGSVGCSSCATTLFLWGGGLGPLLLSLSLLFDPVFVRPRLELLICFLRLSCRVAFACGEPLLCRRTPRSLGPRCRRLSLSLLLLLLLSSIVPHSRSTTLSPKVLLFSLHKLLLRTPRCSLRPFSALWAFLSALSLS